MHIIADQQADARKVTIEVSQLHSVSIEELQNYFEDQGHNVSVHSKTMLGGGRARLELYGLTTDGTPPV